MKKIVIVAACVAMTTICGAALKPSVCVNCGNAREVQACGAVVFKVTGSGKAVVDKGAYKSVSALKIKKGALALEGTYCEADGSCCYDGGMLYATVKAGKKTFKMAAPVELGVWSLFGKNLDDTREFTTCIKKGKSVTLDSVLFLTSEEAEADEVDLSEFALYASAFGKVSFKVSKPGNKGTCSETAGCDPIYTPKSYTGWFVGTYPCVNEEDCFLCDCTDSDTFGGTWKAVYKDDLNSLSEAAALTGVSSLDDDED